jgi:rhodanese-related sulfurtransferase
MQGVQREESAAVARRRHWMWVIPVLALATAWSATVARHDSPMMVPAVSADTVLGYIRDGRKVIFIDARERAEFDESHIPGAINLSLRELEELGANGGGLLQNPDLVVAYCLKDFRGYEVARALQGLGVPAAATLTEQGINGWRKRGLPVDMAGSSDDQLSARALAACAERPNSCEAAP